jgi:hypothetical protein
VEQGLRVYGSWTQCSDTPQNQNHNYMKQLFYFLILSTLSISSYCQQWVDLKDAQTELLGRPISKVNNGSPIFIPDAPMPEITYEVFEGAGSIETYKEKFRKFLTGILDINTYSLKDIKVKKIKYKSIKAVHFSDGSIQLNTKFAYTGETADTVTFKIRRKTGVDLDFKKVLDLILKKIPVNIAGDISSVISTLKADLDDSLSTTISITNPNVFFRARFVQFLNGNPPKLVSQGRTWDDYWIHFYRNGSTVVEEFTTLDASKPQMGRESKRKYVQFWGPNDDKNRLYYFKAKKESGNLKLFFCRFTNNEGEKILSEIPSNNDGQNNVFEIEFSKVDEFLYSGVTKIIYLACYAKQLDNNKIQIHNFDSVANDKEKIISYVKYPEIKFKYLSKND